MELRVLRYFLMAAREENMTKAAELLHVTQPTLSRQIMQLEEELGCKLLRRSNHSIYLTEEGMLLRKRAQDMIALEERTAREFRNLQEEIAGEITIGSGETRGVSEITDVMAKFQNQRTSGPWASRFRSAHGAGRYLKIQFLSPETKGAMGNRGAGGLTTRR